MPTYINGGAVVVEVGGYRVEPGQSLETQDFLQNLPAGVTLDSALPVFDPTLHSEIVTSSKTITVPETSGAYEITLTSVAEDNSVKFNDDSTVAIQIPQGSSYVELCMARIVNDIRAVIAVSGKLLVHIKKV